MLDERHQRQGRGTQAYLALETILHRWVGVPTVRVGILSTNREVAAFWETLGFKDTGLRKPYPHSTVTAEHWVYQKTVPSARERFLMHAPIQHSPLTARPGVIQLTLADAPRLAVLMHEAYRGTVDDEGKAIWQMTSEMETTLRGKWGIWLSEASFAVEHYGQLVSASLITL